MSVRFQGRVWPMPDARAQVCHGLGPVAGPRPRASVRVQSRAYGAECGRAIKFARVCGAGPGGTRLAVADEVCSRSGL